MMFEAALSASSAELKGRAGKVGVIVGREDPTEEEIQAELEARKEREIELAYSKRAAARRRGESTKSATRIVNTVHTTPLPPPPRPVVGDAIPARRKPLEWFRRLAYRVILRLRATRRLMNIKGLLDRDAPTTTVAGSVKLAQPSSMSSSMIRLAALPTFADEPPRRPVVSQPIEINEQFEMLQLRVPQQYKILGYDQITTAHPSAYPMLTNTKPLKSGAENESGPLPPRGVDVPKPAVHPPPVCYGPLATAAIEIFHPEPQLVAHFKQPLHRESDASYALRPRVRDEPAQGTRLMRSIADQDLGPFTLPTATDSWIPSRDRTLRKVPHLMQGPDPEDVMSDDEDDEDPVALQAIKNIAPEEAQVLATFPLPSLTPVVETKPEPASKAKK